MDDETAGGAGGPEALQESPRAHALAGEFVTETLLEYDGGRQVTVYVPPAPPEAVVFAGDGQGFSKWVRFLEGTDLPSTMIIGVHGLADEMPRLNEYSPDFNAERFAAHEKFFVEDVRDAGADVVMSERAVSHGAKLWRGEFPLMVAWAFGR
jgi:hypothetical protein